MTGRIACDWRGRVQERPVPPRTLAEWWRWLWHPDEQPRAWGRYCYRTNCRGEERCVGWEWERD